jgi:hypothetical protein
MMGSSSHPILNAKAKEAHGLLKFAVNVLDKYADRFRELGDEQGARWTMLRMAGLHALDFDKLVEIQPRAIGHDVQLQMLHSCLTHCSCFERAGADCYRGQSPDTYTTAFMIQSGTSHKLI